MGELINRIYLRLENTIDASFCYFLLNLQNKVLASLKGIRIGNGLKTMGKVYFSRFPESSIIIGDNCEFRSAHSSNLIGINKFCILSTHSRNAKIVIGNNCGFSGVTVGCRESIKIGSDCMVGANVIITDTDWHSIEIKERRTGTPKTRPTIIEDNVFIGVNSIILKGAYIGENSVIGAGSVVSGRIPANVIAAGNPCRIIKRLM